MKLVFVLLAALAVQTSARVIREASFRKDIAEFIQPAKLKHSDHLPTKCLPLIKPAYELAVKIRGIFRDGRGLLMKFRGEVIKCYAIANPEDMTKCLDDLKEVALAEGKPWVDNYLKARDSVSGLMDGAEKCLDGKSVAQEFKEVAPTDAHQCLPHVREGYDTAFKLHSITWEALKVAYYASEHYKGCETIENAQDKMGCFVDVMKEVVSGFTPIKRAYLNFRPQVIKVMDKFDTCMAA